jgi:hypothetical protein
MLSPSRPSSLQTEKAEGEAQATCHLRRKRKTKKEAEEQGRI